MRKLRVYIAGPMTNGNGKNYNLEKIREALKAYSTLIREGYLPFCPQLSLLHEMMVPISLTYDQWLGHDQDVIDNSDVIFRMPGESVGADRECKYARGRGIPVVEGSINYFLSGYSESTVCKST